MKKLTLPLKLAALTLATISSLITLDSVKASTFDETPVEQSQFIAVSQPFGDNKYNLIVIEQIPDKQTCWDEIGGNPVSVDILLMNFDFSGHCRRSTDANGYSIRFNGQDLGLDYLLSIVERNGEIQLLGRNRLDRRQPEIVVGTTSGMTNGPMKIQLNPGWRFSKRTYEGKVLGHVYFSYTDEQASIDGQEIRPVNNDNTNIIELDPTNLDNIPEGSVDIIIPENDPMDKMMPKESSVNVNDQEIITSVFVVEEKKQTNSKKSNLTMNRFQRMRNR